MKEGKGKEERRGRKGEGRKRGGGEREGQSYPQFFCSGVWVWGCAAMSQLRRIPTPVGRLYAANLDAARGPLPTEVMLVINLTKRDTPGPVTRRR